MRTFRSLESYRPEPGPAVVALGTFDGIHLGHRAILGTAVDRARSLDGVSVACTFDPHPADVLRPDRAPLPITTLDERLELMAALHLDAAVILAFTPALASMEPEAFISDIVLARLAAREVVVGFNHRFGRGARGDVRLLRDLAARLRFETHVVPPLIVDGGPVSSTEVRAVLARGDVERAARLLGRAYSLAGEVVRGAGRGRSLDFPTANVRPERPPLIPLGVYACRAEAGGVTHRAVVNVGRAPTFGNNAVTVEAHLLDFAGDLYGARLRIDFVGRLREERKFASVEALRAQIGTDAIDARALL